MNDQRMAEMIRKAVEQRCEPLRPDPFLASRVMRMAEQKGEKKVKKKLSLAMILCILLMLATLTAIAAAVVLSGQDVVEQVAIPLAQQNDDRLRPNDIYSHEELKQLMQTAADNGIMVEDASIMEALAKGEGYYEDEVIMAICQAAFGGLYYEWTVEERHWYDQKLVEIGFRDEVYARLPGDGEIAPEEARALAVTLLEAEYGPVQVSAPALYRVVEDFDEGGWYFTWYPRTLEGNEYGIHFSHDRSVVECRQEQLLWPPYSETGLDDLIDRVYGYRSYSQRHWGLEGWYAFGQMLPEAVHTAAWDAEYDGYLATTYLLPGEGDLTALEARAIAVKDAGVEFPISAETLLLGKGDQRIWKVNLRVLNAAQEAETRSWEIDAKTGEILDRMTFDLATLDWARYMLHETYAGLRSGQMTAEDAIALAVAELRERFNAPDLPLDDPEIYDITVRAVADGTRYSVMFNSKSLDYGRCFVWVNQDGTTEVNYARLAPLNADNLADRMAEIYGSSLTWDQARWAEFDRLLDTLGEPLTFEGKLYAATSYPEITAAKITLEEAVDAALRDLGTRSDDAISWVLISDGGRPVWKLRMGTFPANTLYEVDALTGEILDREIYVCQNPDFDHSMKMFTLRSAYMPAALKEFGPVRIAMELTVKAHFDAFSYDETVFMNKNCYEITVDGMTVTFKSIDEYLPSYRTTILDGGMDAEIEVFDVPEPRPESEGSPYGNG